MNFNRSVIQSRLLQTASVIALLVLLFIISPSPTASAGEYDVLREQMVQQDIVRRGVQDKLVLGAMRKIPRHLFVSKRIRRQAYDDHPLPIGEGQTISQPYVVALMTEALKLKGNERVLEIGTGSGYQAAVLAEIVSEVYSIEIRPGLAEIAKRVLAENGYTNVWVKAGDGYYGWPEKAEFDAVIVTAAANHIPPQLIQQLKVGGRLIIPLGRTTYSQYLTLVTKKKDTIEVDQLGAVLFVPMVGTMQKERDIKKAPR